MLDVDIKIQDLALTITEQVAETIYIPMVYLGFQFRPVEKLAFKAEFRGIGYSDSSYYNLIGRLKYKFAGPFAEAGFQF